MRARLAAAALLALAACNKAPTTGHERDGAVRTSPPADADKGAASGDPGALPPPGPVPRFVGRWAANKQACQSAAWQFTTFALRTPAGSSCKFDDVAEVPGGYDIAATCSAEGPPKSDTLHIRFAESAKAMLFDSKTIASKGLVFCGLDV